MQAAGIGRCMSRPVPGASKPISCPLFALPTQQPFSRFVFYNFPLFLTDFSTKFDFVSTLSLGKLH